ncbi:4-hydroxy-tetrahydrodipicolinate synthase [Candidatus Aerophobetes bacterium]|uniref:4-hydroxy-tetrahydrodipicolinate synthase n=1 Tax=Aerophobetes bacterium TaxID=2030807 RepID=A0A523QFY5_UNCAE|nr:MAG: 4-hydroxy-tetrahydrodipicolinate synthase [Candidatus Aerophobetes bacterium]
MFKGCFVAVVTPFKRGEIDEAAFKELVRFLVEKGVDGIVPCGTTGESPALSREEQRRLIKLAVKEARKRVAVIAGTGSNNTKEAEELTEFAKDCGADGALVVAPYYNKPTPRGLESHYRRLERIGLPLVIYNIPSRTGINIPPGIVAKLSQLNNIVGIKEASGSMDQVSSIIAQSEPNFSVLSGDDSLTLPILSLGGVGVVSVVANILPKETHDLVSSYLRGDIERAKQLHYKLFDLFKAMFIETNPLPIKTAMARLGMIEKEWRLPLEAMEEENEEKLERALSSYGLI